MLVDFFDRQVRDLFPNAPPVVGPMAVTIFVWVVLMNTMDLVPVDLIPTAGYLLTGSVPHFKVLPTADLSLTAALALSVFAMTMYYSFKVKGVGGFLHEVATAPFGAKLMPVNILLRCVEEVARPLSLSMRLFGNLFAADFFAYRRVVVCGAVGVFGAIYFWRALGDIPYIGCAVARISLPDAVGGLTGDGTRKTQQKEKTMTSRIMQSIMVPLLAAFMAQSALAQESGAALSKALATIGAGLAGLGAAIGNRHVSPAACWKYRGSPSCESKLMVRFFLTVGLK